MTAFADFFDGESAVVRRVGVALEADTLVIAPAEGAPGRWALEDLRAIPDQASPRALVLTATTHPLARLHLGDADLRRAVEAGARNLRKGQPVRGRGRIAGWALAAVASVALIIFVLVPVMANQLAAILPPEGEKALGDATLGQIREALDQTGLEGLPTCEVPAGRAALDRMTERITAGVELPYALTVTVLDHEMVNAFALPGGHIVFFRGLLDEAETPEEVAAVFAHELGHVVARDPARGALRTAGSIGVLGLLFGDFAGGAAVLFLVERLIEASYSQDAEAAADAFAHQRLRAVDLPPGALGTFFDRLRETYGDAEGIVAHFLSHPQLGDRIARAEAAGAGQGAIRPALDAQAWADLRAICD
jgi:Zn-dependent protease with chaperone function